MLYARKIVKGLSRLFMIQESEAKLKIQGSPVHKLKSTDINRRIPAPPRPLSLSLMLVRRNIYYMESK